MIGLPLAIDWSVIVSATVVAAVVSLAGTVIGAVISRRTDIDVARINAAIEQGKIRLTSELTEKSDIARARREYEYEARKRLYAQCEPVLFQSQEMIHSGRRRMESLARSAKSGDLRPDGSGWLDHHKYYWQSTVYFFLAPLTSYRILQRRITAIDLRLEPELQAQYEILRLMFHGFSADFALAGSDNTQYTPDKADEGQPQWEELRRDQPAVYGRQGFYAGTLQTVVERLVTTSSDGERCQSFGEFSAHLNDRDKATAEFVKNVDEVFGGFHPKRKPILWRVLVTQLVFYETFMAGPTAKEHVADRLQRVAAKFVSADNLSKLDWRSSATESETEIRTPLERAAAYVSSQSQELSALKPGAS